MKKVFVVSWFQSENYGTCLQAYATDYILKKNGFDVRFLNRRKYYSMNKLNYLMTKVGSIIRGRIERKKPIERGVYQSAYNDKVKKIHDLANRTYHVEDIGSRRELLKIDNEIDCYLVGSDQMWNPWMLSPHYLLDFVPYKSNKPRYTYAASFGVDNIPESKKRIYEKYLPLFNCITVREPRAAEVVEQLSGKTAKVVLDPTFLLSREEWREFSEQSDSVQKYNLDRYILCYFIGSPDFSHIDTVKKVAAEINARIVLLPMKESDYCLNDSDITVIADACPYDFISLIEKATLVCTDSFHAVVFSFLMETAFYYFPRFKHGDQYSQEARLQNIMQKFGLEDSFWKEDMSKEQICAHLNVDYRNGYKILEQEREICIRHLVDMLNGKLMNEEKDGSF